MILGRPIAVAALVLTAAAASADPALYTVRDIGSAPGTAQTSDHPPAALEESFKVSDIDAAPTPGLGPNPGTTPTAPEDLFKISDIGR